MAGGRRIDGYVCACTCVYVLRKTSLNHSLVIKETEAAGTLTLLYSSTV